MNRTVSLENELVPLNDRIQLIAWEDLSPSEMLNSTTRQTDTQTQTDVSSTDNVYINTMCHNFQELSALLPLPYLHE